MRRLAAAMLGALLAAGTPFPGAAQVNVHVFPDRFADPAAHAAAEAVASGDVAAAMAAIRRAPGGANTTGADGATLLLMAVERRDHAMATDLLRAGAKPDGGPDAAPLHSAVKNTDLPMIRLLLAAGAKPDATMDGETAMYESALIGASDAAGLLLAAGATIDTPDEVGKTPILVAASAENWAMVAYLLDHGANPWRDAHGITVADFAATSRVLPNNPEGAALPIVIGRLRRAGCPWPPPSVTAVRAMKAQGQWPPAGLPARLP